jgi:hypothetical protein
VIGNCPIFLRKSALSSIKKGRRLEKIVAERDLQLIVIRKRYIIEMSRGHFRYKTE